MKATLLIQSSLDIECNTVDELIKIQKSLSLNGYHCNSLIMEINGVSMKIEDPDEKSPLRVVTFSDGRVNYIDNEGKLLFDKNLEYASGFCEGPSCFQYGFRSWNFINKKGRILFPTNFIHAEFFIEGLAVVLIAENQYNYITPHGQYLLSENVHYADTFIDGYGLVIKKFENVVKSNLVKKDGTFYFDEFQDFIVNYKYNGCGYWSVEKDGELYLLDKFDSKGNLKTSDLTHSNPKDEQLSIKLI